jgi:putative DNA methylase
MTKRRKKLIEVAIPLEAINKASAREKSLRHGHPSTLHLWWSRKPLATARAVIFAQMVDDPSANPDLFKTEKAQEKERQRLFKIIEDLVQWENTTNEAVLAKARAEIWQSWRRACADNVDHPRAKELFDRNKLPAFCDPFAGGGALPLEAQRLGLESYAGDLNPVAVLICKAMIEIPPKFAGRPPVNPNSRAEKTLALRQWKGAQGLAEDVRYYGEWMRNEAEKRIGHLYPKIEITAEIAKDRPDLKPLVGKKLTVIAWLWVRTVKSPNPAFAQVDVPLASTFMLSTKSGKEAYLHPVIENGGYRFTVRVGNIKDAEAVKLGTTAGKRNAFRCLMSGVPITYDHIRREGTAGRMGVRLRAIAAEAESGRVYLSPTPEHEAIAEKAKPDWMPDLLLPDNPRDFKTPNYGMTTFGDLFTPRQLVALTTFSDLVQEAMERVKHHAITAGIPDDSKPLRDGGTGATAYSEAIAVYLNCGISRSADFWSNLCIWANQPKNELVAHLFGRQAIPMAWDYAEANPFSNSGGNFEKNLSFVAKGIDFLTGAANGFAHQSDATANRPSSFRVVSTDPPYYDNIGYADLSDYFYIWLRRSLRCVFPELFATLAVPKAEELVATPYRHGGKDEAEAFFLDGMTRAMRYLAAQTHPAFPTTIYYAFKQSESESDSGTASTGWETFLNAVIEAGLAMNGTWPMRTERVQGLKGELNALASSIVLVCRTRPTNATTATRRDFVNALKTELPAALAHLQRSNIAPVDLAQAAIGPGMAIYTRYAQVIDAAGKPVPVREALALINQSLDEVLAEQEGDFDADTRWAVAWFEQQGFAEGEFGVAETLSKAKNTSIAGMAEARILSSKRGKVRLLKPNELLENWDPGEEPRLTAWQVVHQLIRVLEAGGESAAASLVSKLGGNAEIARELAYRLYTIAERKKRAAEALSYNSLVQSWPEITGLARAETAPAEPAQAALL